MLQLRARFKQDMDTKTIRITQSLKLKAKFLSDQANIKEKDYNSKDQIKMSEGSLLCGTTLKAKEDQ
jgi:hypothetical protein